MTKKLLRAVEAVYRDFARWSRKRQPQRDMTVEDEEFLKNNLNFSFMADAKNIELMSRFSVKSREEFALRTGSFVLYTPEEAGLIKSLEEAAALRAAPLGYELSQLNGINVGCGDRRISEYLTPIDIMREAQDASGVHHAFLKDAFLANPEALPYKSNTLDYIVALHMLEHVFNPVEILLHWGELLKPGGGIGLILPNARYTWDAAGDDSQFGHKWNPSAAVFRRLYETHLKDYFELESIETLSHKISFDVILRKPGQFRPFAISNLTSPASGAQLARAGAMASQFDDE